MAIQWRDPVNKDFRRNRSKEGENGLVTKYKEGNKLSSLERAHNVLSGAEDVDNRSFLKRAADKATGVEFETMDQERAMQTIRKLDPEMWLKIDKRRMEMEKVGAAKQKALGETRDLLGEDSLNIINQLQGLGEGPERDQAAANAIMGLKEKFPDFADKIELDVNNDGVVSDDELNQARQQLMSYGEEKEAQSTEGKLAEDLKNKIITQEEYDDAQKGQTNSAVERMTDRLLALHNKALNTELTPEEKNESNLLEFAIKGKKRHRITDEEGHIQLVDSSGEVTEIKDDEGNPMVDIAKVKEDRLKANSVATNQKTLTDTYQKVVGDDVNFIKETSGITIDTGRESVDDTRLSYMFARTLPGVGKEIAQGDIGQLAAIPNLPEKFIQAFKSLAAGKTLPPDIRKSMSKSIIAQRNIRIDRIQRATKDLQKQAQNTNTPDWSPPGANEGTEFNPYDTEGMSFEEVEGTVKKGDWFWDDGEAMQRE